jgi:hypothetical protein
MRWEGQECVRINTPDSTAFSVHDVSFIVCPPAAGLGKAR